MFEKIYIFQRIRVDSANLSSFFVKTNHLTKSQLFFAIMKAKFSQKDKNEKNQF